MRVKAIQRMYYDKKDRLPGEEYEMDDREYGEAKILAVLGKIEIMPKETVAARRTYETAAVKAEDQPEEKPAAPVAMTTDNSDALVSSPRRQYRRRDMKAER
jgi:hypothetical protein